MSSQPKNWISSDRFIPRKFVRPVLELMHTEVTSGIVLVAAAAAAMLWANLPMFGGSYHDFWHGNYLELSFGPFHLREDFKGLVNDGLMAIFFLAVGLEIKRELVLGELRDRRKAALPVAAAIGGMALPALIYLGFNAGNPEAISGWGVPMATDIAFSLGILALVGRRAPVGVRLFLLAVAIADDIGAIAVIAIFYTSDLDLGYLGWGIAAFAIIIIGTRVNIRSHVFYVPVALIAWYCFLESGVHATIAGVIVGFIAPARPLYDAGEFDRATRRIVDIFPAESDEPFFREKVEHEARLLSEVARESIAPLTRVQHLLHNWSAFVIVPIFALANAGIPLGGVDLTEALTSPITIGVAAGLVIGKALGITGFAWLVIKVGWGRMPDSIGWRHMRGVGLLAGVGFTVALFIAEMAYDDNALVDLSKLGIFAGSIIAGVLGYLLLRSVPLPDRSAGTRDGGGA